MRRRDVFAAFAAWTARAAAGRWAFLLATLSVIVWAVTGPMFKYSSDWQLVINTGTTIVTFLMVFLIQNSQNRESKAVHLKLDELIHAVQRANNHMINIEDLSDDQLDSLGQWYRRIAERYDANLQSQLEAVGGEVEDVEDPFEQAATRVGPVAEKVHEQAQALTPSRAVSQSNS
jgi:low affinity Fe/Cu permease